ncbi:hypothetical protein [Streptomyces sp. NPDC003077]|uniref:hypothetical protein n=1 Tax=Streptomyces sp. NPDC003077 TaxID=3154443 RepID=UPI0033BB5A78
MERAPNLRMIALASTVALAAALPLAAATAGPTDAGRRASVAAHSSSPHAGRSATRPDTADQGARGASPDTASPADRPPTPDAPETASPAAGDVLPGLGLGAADPGRHTAECGPELSSPQGVKAQTCVLSRSDRTWARTYYRNTSGQPLRAVLTLMRPDGGTVQVHCELSPRDEPGTCETPREPTIRARADEGTRGETAAEGSEAGRLSYDAVAELSDLDGERLWLRSGSNTTPPALGAG